MNNKNFAFAPLNYALCAVAVCIIIIGFVLMTGPATTFEHGYEPDIFSSRRIVVAPMLSFFGFLLMIVGILYPRASHESKADKSK